MTRNGPATTYTDAGAAQLEELRLLLSRQSIRRGDFTLTSGQKSRYYCDTKSTVLSPRGAWLIGHRLFDLLRAYRPEAVGGQAIGATYLAAVVAMASDEQAEPISGFAVRPQQKEHGTGARIDQAWHADGELVTAGRRVAVVEDVVTTAGSTLRAIEAVRETGAEIVAVAAVLDRQAGGAERIAELGLPFAALYRADSSGELTTSAEWTDPPG